MKSTRRISLDISCEEGNSVPIEIALTISPSYDAEGFPAEASIAVCDVTREKEIRRLQGECFAIASHQLRTPLVGIQWVAERIMKKEKLTAEGVVYVDQISKSATRLARLVDVLLGVSRFEAGVGASFRSFDLVRLVNDYLAECEALAERKNIALSFPHYPETLFIESDANAVHLILDSIILNAMEYTPQDGAITVFLAVKDSECIISVGDTGIGIPLEDQRKVFRKFYRASNAKRVKTGGTGLGLYIALTAAKFLGGKIWLESPARPPFVPGRSKKIGTVFHIALPVLSKKPIHSQSIVG